MQSHDPEGRVMRNTLAFMLLGATLALACDDRAGQTTTTTATEDLKQAGREVGSATQKAAEHAGRVVKDEAKREVKDLDVRVTTPARDGGH